MQFLNPVFLLAGLTLAIPVFIHLFNLRRFKTVLFPHSRFLKNLQLQSQKQSQLRHKWLLLCRMLFLALLILAFAQPFLSGSSVKKDASLTAIYIDNSLSMSATQGQRSLLDMARENAKHLVAAHKGSFLIFSNDAPASYEPLTAQAALEAIDRIPFSAVAADMDRTLQMIEGLTQDRKDIDVYYLSDFRQAAFHDEAATHLTPNIHFNGVQIRAGEAKGNIYIDTAFLEYPSLQTGKQNRLIVQTRYSGKRPEEKSVLQLTLDGSVKSAATIDFADQKEHSDTLSFETVKNGWQQLVLSINDASVHFDDTLLIAAKSASDLSVLLVQEGLPNVFLTAALRSYPGFKVTEAAPGRLPQEMGHFNLILISGLHNLSAETAKQLTKALNEGVNVCIFPGADMEVQQVNTAISALADIRFEAADTAAQTVSELQTGHQMVKELFERIPENVQLPFVRMHYPIKSSLNSNQQNLLSFRNGDPFFSVLDAGNAHLYLCAAPADPAFSNFQESYFFVPFLYQMASLSQTGDVYSICAGQQQAVFVPRSNGDARTLFHLYGKGTDMIPAQKPEGRGVWMNVANNLNHAGFYTLATNAGDTVQIGANMSRAESILDYRSLEELRSAWSRKGDSWQQADAETKAVKSSELSSFPLWKLCSILALGMLLLEVYLLSKNHFKKNTTTT